MKGEDIQKYVSDFAGRFHTETQRLKKIKALLSNITGGNADSDAAAGVEAMVLALKHDKSWQRVQSYTIKHLSDVVAEKASLLKHEDNKRIDNVQVLIKAGITRIATKILQVRIPELYFERDDHKIERGIIAPTDTENEIPWYLVHYYCIDLLSNIVKLFYNSETTSFIKVYLPKMLKNGNVEAMMTFVNAEEPCVLITCTSVRALCHLSEKSQEACERAVFCGAIHKLGKLIYKDTAAKLLYKWAKDNPNDFEMHILASNHGGLMPYSNEKTIISLGYKPFQDDQEMLNVAMKWSHTLQSQSIKMLRLCAELNDRHRQLILKDPVTMKALMRWLRTPPVTAHDVYMTEQSSKILCSMVLNEDMAWTLVQEHNIVRILEIGVYYPLKENVVNLLQTCANLALHSGKVKNKVGQSEDLLRAVAMHMNGTVVQIVNHALTCCVLFSEGPSASTLIKFLGPRELYFLEDFHRSELTSKHIQDIRRNYNKSASFLWKKAEKDFQKDVELIVVDREKTEELKAEGNEFFKKGAYQEALEKYTEAIRICPPNSSKGHSCTHSDGNSHGNNHIKKQRWHVLPATLLCNRAQCYLYLKEYRKAVDDCDQAIARCLDYQVNDILLSVPYKHQGCDSCAEIFEARKAGEPLITPLVVKAMYRRSKALFEIDHFQRALVDISRCVALESDQPMFESHMEKVLVTYRGFGGMESIKRCGYCQKGEGQKLKRCANCEAIYCSKECQLMAWEKGHKTNCRP